MARMKVGKWSKLYKDSTASFDTLEQGLSAEPDAEEPNVPLSIRLYGVVSKDDIQQAIKGRMVLGVVWTNKEHAIKALSNTNDPSDSFLAYSWLTVSQLKSRADNQDLEQAVESPEGIQYLGSLDLIDVLSPSGNWLQRSCATPLTGFVYGL